MQILWRFLLRHTALLDLERERMGGSRASQSNPVGSFRHSRTKKPPVSGRFLKLTGLTRINANRIRRPGAAP
ncbi:hypothetical protein AB395_00001681 [Sinorhizobium fredii CCBAU 45436]|nr:hypothetical protein AB395_00001681 [Sinorhizobium fredii CCBAU 45436]